MHHIFLSCDWGTTNFRLRLVDRQTLEVKAVIQSEEGVASVFAQWQQTAGATDRVLFYQQVLQRHVAMLEQQIGKSLTGIPMIISGMASSSIGMIELPYKQLPLSIMDIDLLYNQIAATTAFSHSIVLVSGARTEGDVMRGEETQLTGCNIDSALYSQVFIFPGTHSKHVAVANGVATDFATYITGEVFQLLANKSILANSVAANDAWHETGHRAAFEQGVLDGQAHNILHQAFMVRTNSLFDRFSASANYWYLSGLLIGHELQSLQQTHTGPITIVGNGVVVDIYQAACTVLGLQNVKSEDANIALVRAHAKLFDKLFANTIK
ncbi:2-dehydro-3-deoxygalactonokinase [Paracnuella aquatica]|uniref:2-dehydro-3-deoxygalactonokinase n=1 Tax=Paracnuella aquatica TaxID=2268757 RepID=UPI000DEEB11C|nr:2-dehydro-3-deoxygalactonokinase [Paracnuella aquatica]RPD48768.1 2-keto-3-deoxy-galactonokinase [Paracnuella aquatica]